MLSQLQSLPTFFSTRRLSVQAARDAHRRIYHEGEIHPRYGFARFDGVNNKVLGGAAAFEAFLWVAMGSRMVCRFEQLADGATGPAYGTATTTSSSTPSRQRQTGTGWSGWPSRMVRLAWWRGIRRKGGWAGKIRQSAEVAPPYHALRLSAQGSTLILAWPRCYRAHADHNFLPSFCSRAPLPLLPSIARFLCSPTSYITCHARPSMTLLTRTISKLFRLAVYALFDRFQIPEEAPGRHGRSLRLRDACEVAAATAKSLFEDHYDPQQRHAHSHHGRDESYASHHRGGSMSDREFRREERERERERERMMRMGGYGGAGGMPMGAGGMPGIMPGGYSGMPGGQGGYAHLGHHNPRHHHHRDDFDSDEEDHARMRADGMCSSRGEDAATV